jgi:hypothetical protein
LSPRVGPGRGGQRVHLGGREGLDVNADVVDRASEIVVRAGIYFLADLCLRRCAVALCSARGGLNSGFM